MRLFGEIALSCDQNFITALPTISPLRKQVEVFADLSNVRVFKVWRILPSVASAITLLRSGLLPQYEPWNVCFRFTRGSRVR